MRPAITIPSSPSVQAQPPSRRGQPPPQPNPNKVPSFLASDQRLGVGGPFYWSSKMRLVPCEYMQQPDRYTALWQSCEALTGLHMQ